MDLKERLVFHDSHLVDAISSKAAYNECNCCFQGQEWILNRILTLIALTLASNQCHLQHRHERQRRKGARTAERLRDEWGTTGTYPREGFSLAGGKKNGDKSLTCEAGGLRTSMFGCKGRRRQAEGGSVRWRMKETGGKCLVTQPVPD